MTTTPSRKRAARVGGGRKTANRFAHLAGGDDTTTASSQPADTGGLIAGITAAATTDLGDRVIKIPVSETAPHPFNTASRSEPKPGNPKWDELVNSVRTNGVQLPVLAVTRDAFLATRPSLEGHVSADARYVIIYGHRRRAATLFIDANSTIPAVVDDSYMSGDGDLDAMAVENLGREDLSAIAEAELFARYSDLGLSQRDIAERLGVDQATVSRRLALLLLTPRIQAAVDAGEFPSADAAVLAGALPFGAARKWQKSAKAGQDSVTRHDDQELAFRLIVDKGMSASRAADRVIAERSARETAAARGIEIIADPREHFGADFYNRRVFDGDEYDAVVGAIDPDMGTLILYSATDPIAESETIVPAPASPAEPAARPTTDRAPETADTDDGPFSAGGDPATPAPAVTESVDDDTTLEPSTPPIHTPPAVPQVDRDKDAKAASVRARRDSCGDLAASVPSKTDLAAVLVDQYVTGVAASGFSAQADNLIAKWGAETKPSGDKSRQSLAWMRAIAAGEMYTSSLDDAWDAAAVAHVRRLISRVDYRPTRWEQTRIDAATA